jgi:hypothetical protein
MGKRVFCKRRHLRRDDINREKIKTYKYVDNHNCFTENINFNHSFFYDEKLSFSYKKNVSSEALLKIEIPPKYLLKLKHVECAGFLTSEFPQIILGKTSCEVCGLNNPTLMSAHYIYKNIIKSKGGNREMIRIFDRVECICIFCHRVKHLLNILESDSNSEDITMDLKWLKIVNNFTDIDIVKYFKEVKEMNSQMKKFDSVNFCRTHIKNLKENIKNNYHLTSEIFYYNNSFRNNSSKFNKQPYFTNDSFPFVNYYDINCTQKFLIDTHPPEFQSSCYFSYNLHYLSETEKVFREIILKDRENRFRIFTYKEGQQKNKKEFNLMINFLKQMENLFSSGSTFVLEYEWEIKQRNKIIGVGDLVLTDGTNFYVTEIKFLNQKNKLKKVKKLEEQIERYTKLYHERQKDLNFYSLNFKNKFADINIHKIYGIKFTNEDEEIRCCYCIGE